MREDFSIVFMGTPEFAVTILDALNQNGIAIKAVITAPDKPSGRGQKINQSDVKRYAIEKNLPILQPANLKSDSFVSELQALNADLFVVVAFRMLPEVVWAMPPRGTINLHASLLPNYRGAAPINWAIINGESETGVSTFFIEKEIDTGKIIEQEKVRIEENESVGELYQRLMHLGAKTMLSTITKIKTGNVLSIEQKEVMSGSLKSAPKIFKTDCQINFNHPVAVVHNFCRGLSPYPAAWTKILNQTKVETKNCKIFKTRKTTIPITDSSTIKSDQDGILIPCEDFYIRVLELQIEGKRKMNFKDFLVGNSVLNLSLVGN
jgi:methionyl-tRNA formyltransferase